MIGGTGATGFVRIYLLLIMLAIAQTYVVYAGEIDLPVWVIVLVVNVVIVVLIEKIGDCELPVIAA